MKEVSYKGYVIKLDDHIVGKNHPMQGKWVSGEYSIGKDKGESYTEKKFVHKAEFFENEANAQKRTLQLAMTTIDNDEVGF